MLIYSPRRDIIVDHRELRRAERVNPLTSKKNTPTNRTSHNICICRITSVRTQLSTHFGHPYPCRPQGILQTHSRISFKPPRYVLFFNDHGHGPTTNWRMCLFCLIFIGGGRTRMEVTSHGHFLIFGLAIHCSCLTQWRDLENIKVDNY